MCQFLSWIELNGELLYLTRAELKTKKGRELIRDLEFWPWDISGHGAIRMFYLPNDHIGIERECSDFSNPSNFPKKIADTIKAGEFRGIGMSQDLLNEKGRKELRKKSIEEFSKIKPLVKAITEKMLQKAIKAYKKNEIDLEKYDELYWKERGKARNKAGKEYEKAKQTIFWDLFADPTNRAGVWR